LIKGRALLLGFLCVIKFQNSIDGKLSIYIMRTSSEGDANNKADKEEDKQLNKVDFY